MKFVYATVMVLLVTVTSESWAANETASSTSTKTAAKPNRSLFLPKTSTSVSYYPTRTVSVSSSSSHYPQPTYAPNTITTSNSTERDDDVFSATTAPTTVTPIEDSTDVPRSQDKKMDRSGLSSSTEIYHPPSSVRRTTGSLPDPLSVYVPGNISLQKVNAERKMSSYSSYGPGPSSKLNTSPVTIMVHASPDKVPKIKPRRKNPAVSNTDTKKRSDQKPRYSTLYPPPPTSSAYHSTKSYQTTPMYKASASAYRSPRPTSYEASSNKYESSKPVYHNGDSSSVPTTQAGLVNYMVRNLLMQANVMNQLLPLVQQIASQVPSVLADVEAAKNALAFSEAKDEVTNTLNNAVAPYSKSMNNENSASFDSAKTNRPASSFSSPMHSSSNVYHQDDRETNYFANIKHKPTEGRGYTQSKTNTDFKPVPLPKYDQKFTSYGSRPHDDFYSSSQDEDDDFKSYRPHYSNHHEKTKVTQGPYSSLQVGNKQFTLPTFKISLQSDGEGRQSSNNKLAVGERPYFTMGEDEMHHAAESFAKNNVYYTTGDGRHLKTTSNVVNSVVPIVLQLHHSRKQNERDSSPSVIKVVEVKETRNRDSRGPSPTIVEVVEEKEDRKPVNPIIQVIEVNDDKRKSASQHFYTTNDGMSQESIHVEEKNPQKSLDDKYEEIKKAVLKEAAFREATIKEAARIVKNIQMDSSSFGRLPDSIKDHSLHDAIEDQMHHSSVSRPSLETMPYRVSNKDRFKDFYDESERFNKGSVKMGSEGFGHSSGMKANAFKNDPDTTFGEISHRLRSGGSSKDLFSLPTSPEELGLEGTQLDILKEAITKAMDEERKSGKPKEIHVMPKLLEDHMKEASETEKDLSRFFADEHKFNRKPKVHLIPIKSKKPKINHDLDFITMEDASPHSVAGLSEEAKKVLAQYSAIDVIRPNMHMMPHHPHPFSGMHPPHPYPHNHPYPMPRLPMPGPYPHGPMPPRPPMPPGPMPYPPRPFPMGPFPFGRGPPRGPPPPPYPMPLPPGPMGPYPRPPMPPPPPPPYKREDKEEEVKTEETEPKTKK